MVTTGIKSYKPHVLRVTAQKDVVIIATHWRWRTSMRGRDVPLSIAQEVHILARQICTLVLAWVQCNPK